MSEHSSVILDRMEPGRPYEPRHLLAFVPGISVERLHEIMHQLWIDRQVERVGYSGWRRHQSASPHARPAVSGEVQHVKPEELFDHATFEEFFR